jgi:hypothetical protein
MLLEKVTLIKKVETSAITVALRSDGIMQYTVKGVSEFNLADLREANEAAGMLGNRKAYPNLVYVDHFLNVDPECRKYAATEESNRYTVADALVVNSVALRLIANFYVKVNKPVRPTKIFTSVDDAVSWLYSFL